MPSFYQDTMSQRLPLTPPEKYGHHLDSGYASGQVPTCKVSLADPRTSAPHYENRSRGSTVPEQHYQQYQSATTSQKSYCPELRNHMQLNYPAPSRHEALRYAPVYASLLPPIRAPDRASGDFNDQTQDKRALPLPQAKEEKIGGVAAHLDYEMDEMVDFVSEMAQGMYDIFASKICLADIDMTRSVLSSKSSPPRDFRKYVSQVLSSTRLPSSTILLGLLYLSERMTILSQRGNYGQGNGDVYSMLTIGLVLGSKFLDDNTFQNRSWSEVSNISVNELNLLEIQWLVDIKWNLHIDQEDPEGFQLWLQQWERFQARKVDVSLANSMKQANLGGNTRQHQPQRNAPQLPSLNTDFAHLQSNGSSRVGFGSQHQGPWNTPQHMQWNALPSQHNYSPPSAPETGPNTPDAYGLLNSLSYAPQPMHPSFKLAPALHILPSNAPSTGYPTPYVSQYNQYNHGHCCDSGFSNPHEGYLWGSGYASQPVAG